MLHDYGFYKFEKCINYIEHRKDLEQPHLKPLFASREQYIYYDECSQFITACMRFFDLRIRSKEYQG